VFSGYLIFSSILNTIFAAIKNMMSVNNIEREYIIYHT